MLLNDGGCSISGLLVTPPPHFPGHIHSSPTSLDTLQADVAAVVGGTAGSAFELTQHFRHNAHCEHEFQQTGRSKKKKSVCQRRRARDRPTPLSKAGKAQGTDHEANTPPFAGTQCLVLRLMCSIPTYDRSPERRQELCTNDEYGASIPRYSPSLSHSKPSQHFVLPAHESNSSAQPVDTISTHTESAR